jgi:hypothetical protein
MYATLTFLAWRAGGVRDTPWPLLLALMMVAALGAVFGADGVAFGLGLSPLVVEAPQVASLLRRDAVVLSRAAYLFALLEAAAWLPYAYAHRDVAIGLWGVSACVSCSAVLLTRRRRERSRSEV